MPSEQEAREGPELLHQQAAGEVARAGEGLRGVPLAAVSPGLETERQGEARDADQRGQRDEIEGVAQPAVVQRPGGNVAAGDALSPSTQERGVSP